MTATSLASNPCCSSQWSWRPSAHRPTRSLPSISRRAAIGACHCSFRGRAPEVSSDLGPLATQLMLVAPPGFSFPTLCGELCSSFGEFFEGTGRPVASLLTTAALGLDLDSSASPLALLKKSFVPFCVPLVLPRLQAC